MSVLERIMRFLLYTYQVITDLTVSDFKNRNKKWFFKGYLFKKYKCLFGNNQKNNIFAPLKTTLLLVYFQ